MIRITGTIMITVTGTPKTVILTVATNQVRVGLMKTTAITGTGITAAVVTTIKLLLIFNKTKKAG